MPAPVPYLIFNGDAADAAAAYIAIFGGEIVASMPMSAAPPDLTVPDERKDWLMHCELSVGGGRLFLSDDFMANSPPMQGNSVMMEMETEAAARAAFEKLAEGGAIGMDFAPTFWSAGFGTVVDRFGIRWMIGTSEPPAPVAA